MLHSRCAGCQSTRIDTCHSRWILHLAAPEREASSEISDLLIQQYDQNRKTGTFSGYRLQLYFGSGVNARAHAEKVRTEFNNLYPDMKVYLSFKSPDFIVRAGDFRSRSEALKVLRSLTPGFANAFIVTDEIFSPVLTVQGEIK